VFDLGAAVQAFINAGHQLGLTRGGALTIRNESQWYTPERLQLEKWLWNHMCAHELSNEFSADLCERFELALRCSATVRPEVIR